MAASSSSSSGSVVDLGTELDDATSKLFFRAAGPVLSWPASSEIESTMKSQESLVALCSTHGVPSELTPVCAHHLGLTASTPPPVGSNKLCVYAAALATGLRFPLHEFYARILRHYHLAPAQLTPNSWSYLAAFVLLCKDAGVPPMVSAFRYFFTICAHQHQGKPTGWHHFKPYFGGTRRLFAGALPSRSGWKSRFFYLDGPKGWNWNCQVRWGKPKKEDARRVQLTDNVIETLKGMVKKDDGVVEYIDIKVFLANHREMPVGGPDALAQLKSAVKVEAGAAGAAVAAAGGAAAEAESASTRKRSRLSSAAAVLSQPPPLQPTPAPAGFAPVRASSSGGRSGHVPPPGLPPIRAASTGGHNEHTSPPGLPPIRASSTGGSSSGHVPPPTSALWELRGVRAPAQDVTPPEPQRMSACDMLQLWEARTKIGEQAAMITKLNRDLQLVKTWNTQWQKELKDAGDKHAAQIAELITRLRAANDRNNHLNEELVQYAAERDQLIGHLRSASVEVARLQAASVEAAQLHAAEKEELAKQREELMDDAEQLKHEGYTMGARHMREHALNMYKDVINPDLLKVEMLPYYGYQTQGAPPVAEEDQ